MQTPAPATLSLGGIDDLLPVYENMQNQFPPNEMYAHKVITQLLYKNKYKILLYRRDGDQALIGYALVYTIDESNLVWLDYIAILDEFKHQGYGGALLNALWQKYCGPFYGILFSVEHVCADNPALAATQEARLRFYERQGAFRLHTDFLLPTDNGSLPMYLYFKPHKGVGNLCRNTQLQAVSQMYDYCFFYLKHCAELLHRIKPSMVDETFEKPAEKTA